MKIIFPTSLVVKEADQWRGSLSLRGNPIHKNTAYVKEKLIKQKSHYLNIKTELTDAVIALYETFQLVLSFIHT